jgi:hypothetical protein
MNKKPERPVSDRDLGFLERMSIWSALEANPELLARRLRSGTASLQEMAFAADLIEKKVRPRRLKSGTLKRMLNEEIAETVLYTRFTSRPENAWAR